MKTSLLALAFTLTFAGASFAHSPVETSSPADGEILVAAPETLVLNFEKAARVLRVEVTHTTVDGSASHASDLDIPSRDLTETLSLTPPSMGAGSYLVEWRALGEDGHAMDGTFTYNVTAQ